MSQDATLPSLEKWIRMNLPKRDELLFRTVRALPKASNTGFVWTIWSSNVTFLSPCDLLWEAPTTAKYAITYKRQTTVLLGKK